MTGKISRGRLLASTFMVGSLAFATPAIAQDTQQAPIAPPAAANNPAPPSVAPPGATATPGVSSANGQSAAATGGEIIVTGSRIPHPNLESASPVTVVGSQEVKLTGTTRTEDLLNSLPQVFAGQGGGTANGATGTATIDLRDLGSVRTLVLIDGRRLVPGDPALPVPDINIIPAALIKRVDVLTGGASSVYGADAVAGVVNFVMDTDFDGFKLDSQYSFYQHDNSTKGSIINALQGRGFGYPTGNTVDGAAIDTTAVMGASFDDGRGHVTAYAGYRKINPVLQSSRDYSSCALQSKTAGNVAAQGLYGCGGSSTSPSGTFLTNVGTYHVEGDQFKPNAIPYNYGPLNYYQRPDERYTAGFFAHYDVNDNFKPYMEFMFMDDRTVAQIAASGDFGQTGFVNCDNPLLSAQERGVICSPANLVTDANGAPAVFTDANGNTYNRGVAYLLRRNVEGGPRQDDLQHTTYRGVIGAKGDIARGISYDAYYQYGRVDYAETYLNEFSVKRITNALNVVTDPATGLPTCRSVLDGTDTNCVPWNVFQTGGVTQAAINYLSAPGFQRGQTTEQVADANVTFLGGEYGVQSPWANEGVALNVGAEYRKETLNLNTDLEFQTGDLAGQGAPTLPVHGSFNVKEVFAELSVPIVQDRPFFQNLTFTGGYRRSHYETSSGSTFNTDTWKLQLEWAPTRDIKFRGGYNRAVRAPNVVELFQSQHIQLDGSLDPCAGDFDAGTPLIPEPTATAAQCALTGVSAAQYGHIPYSTAGQYNGLTGGNPNLQPEVSKSWTAGAVLTPTFLRGFSATVDYFHIKVNNLIGVLGANNIIKQCVASGQYCNLIHRDKRGSLYLPGTDFDTTGYIIDTNINAGSLMTDGIDFTAGYTQDLGGAGTLGLDGTATWLHRFIIHNVGQQAFDCAKLYGAVCGTPAPEWRSNVRLTYTAPSGPSVSLRWRYFSAVKEDTTSSNPELHGTTNPGDARIGAQSYFDLAATFPVADKFTFRIGANNVLDREPPIVGLGLNQSAYNGNTFPVVYDALGRYIYAGVTFDL